MNIELRSSADAGSIPLALLIIIALTGIVGGLAITTVGGTRATRFDGQYLQAIQVADAGAQEGATRLIRSYSPTALQDEAVPAGCAPDNLAACSIFDSGAGTINGLPYTWEAYKTSARTYQVRSVATAADGVVRTVAVDVRESARFFVAAFSDRGFTLRGGNQADSYGEGSWFTGNGIIGSNGSITLNGASTGVDAVQLYDWADNPDFGRCTHQGGTDCDDVLTLPDAIAPSARIDEELQIGPNQELDTQFIDEQLAACPTPLLDYTASINGTVLGSVGTETVLCFESFTADADITVQGEVDIYLSGDLFISNGVEVNCPTGCAVGSSAPDATALSFFVDGTGDPLNASLVAVGNHTRIAAGIYAPESDCEGNPSNAQSDIFGSLICGVVSNQGGWSFHYDDRLINEGSGDFAVTAWREEVG